MLPASAKNIFTLKIVSPVLESELREITPTSVTQGKTRGNLVATHAVDKDLSTVAGTGTANGAGWLKLEFDKSYFIHKVVIYSRFYTNWYNPNQFCVKSVNNFKNCVDRENNVDVSVYQGEVQQKSCGTLELTYGLEQADQIYTLICNTKGNTVKLSKTSGWIVVYEIAVTSPGD